MIDMNTTTEVGVLFAGVSFGVGMALKAVKWGKDLFSQQKPELKIPERINGERYLSHDEHEALCSFATSPITESVARIEMAIKDSNRDREVQTQRIFDKIDSFKESVSIYGERIAALEARQHG